MINVDLHINEYDPIAARSYKDLPSKLKLKKAIVNPINEDNVSNGRLQQQYIHHNHPERITKLEKTKSEKLWNGVEFPMQMVKLVSLKRIQIMGSMYMGIKMKTNIRFVYLTMKLGNKQ